MYLYDVYIELSRASCCYRYVTMYHVLYDVRCTSTMYKVLCTSDIFLVRCTMYYMLITCSATCMYYVALQGTRYIVCGLTGLV